jgi:hypothetical protein
MCRRLERKWAKDGPPSGPAGLRVSTSRRGVTGTKRCCDTRTYRRSRQCIRHQQHGCDPRYQRLFRAARQRRVFALQSDALPVRRHAFDRCPDLLREPIAVTATGVPWQCSFDRRGAGNERHRGSRGRTRVPDIVGQWRIAARGVGTELARWIDHFEPGSDTDRERVR